MPRVWVENTAVSLCKTVIILVGGVGMASIAAAILPVKSRVPMKNIDTGGPRGRAVKSAVS